jgi:hypothetical protein
MCDFINRSMMCCILLCVNFVKKCETTKLLWAYLVSCKFFAEKSYLPIAQV